MAGSPDLFVVCKNCQAEVSPYITECPYCGHRLRKRAPKLDKGAVPRAPKPPRRPISLGGIRGTVPPPRARTAPRFGARDTDREGGRPYATIALVLGAIVVTLLAKAALIDGIDLIVGPPDEVWQRALTAPFLYVSTSYELVALGCVFLFGWRLERRHGFWAPLLVFLLAGAGGMYAADALDAGAIAAGGNGAALGLLAAWVVPDLLARRRREETDFDGLGVLVLAVLLVMLPAVIDEAHPLAGAAGGLLGLLLGLVLAQLRRR